LNEYDPAKKDIKSRVAPFSIPVLELEVVLNGIGACIAQYF